MAADRNLPRKPHPDLHTSDYPGAELALDADANAVIYYAPLDDPSVEYLPSLNLKDGKKHPYIQITLPFEEVRDLVLNKLKNDKIAYLDELSEDELWQVLISQ